MPMSLLVWQSYNGSLESQVGGKNTSHAPDPSLYALSYRHYSIYDQNNKHYKAL